MIYDTKTQRTRSITGLAGRKGSCCTARSKNFGEHSVRYQYWPTPHQVRLGAALFTSKLLCFSRVAMVMQKAFPGDLQSYCIQGSHQKYIRKQSAGGRWSAPNLWLPESRGFCSSCGTPCHQAPEMLQIIVASPEAVTWPIREFSLNEPISSSYRETSERRSLPLQCLITIGIALLRFTRDAFSLHANCKWTVNTPGAGNFHSLPENIISAAAQLCS